MKINSTKAKLEELTAHLQSEKQMRNFIQNETILAEDDLGSLERKIEKLEFLSHKSTIAVRKVVVSLRNKVVEVQQTDRRLQSRRSVGRRSEGKYN